MCFHIDNIRYEKLTFSNLKMLKKISLQTFIDAFAAQNNVENFSFYLETAFSDEKLRKELTNENSTFYFVKNNDEILGYLKVNFGNAQTDFKKSDGMEIERIYVLKDFQGQKLGAKMLTFAINIAAKAKMKYIWLGVWDKNVRAISFYEKHGFEIFSSHPFKMGDEIQTDYLMKLSL